MEDTTFATFVIGAVFGSLLWYWLRRLTRYVGSDEDYLLSIRHPSRIIVAVEIAVSLFLVIILVWLLTLLLEIPERPLPQWVPHGGYLHDIVAREPIGYLLLGFLFGLLLGEWLSYILLPPELKTDALRDSHTRWGYFLVGIVLLGLVYALLLPLLRTLKAGDVKTPIGSLSFGVKEPEKGANITGTSAFTASQLKDTNRPLDELPGLKTLAKRDEEYARLFLGGKDNLLDVNSGPSIAVLEKLEKIHSHDEPFLELVETFGTCVREHWKIFHSVQMISQQIRPILPIYTGFVRGHDNHLLLLKQAITKASRGVAADIISAETNIPREYIDATKDFDENYRYLVSKQKDAAKDLNENQRNCLTVADKADALPDTKLNLPYAAFGLAHLFYDAGEHQQAARTIADWLDAQYSLEDCNKTEPSCPPSRDAYPIGYGVPGNRKALPIWYRIRMEYELAVILEGTDATRSIVEAQKRLEASYKELFSNYGIQSAASWMDHCREQAQDDPLKLKARLVFAFLSTVAERIQYQAAMIDAGLIPAAEVMTDQEREDGKLLTGTKFDCFNDPSYASQQDKGYYEGSFYSQYGTVLALSAKAKDASWEIERVEQKRLLDDARLQLDRAVQVLKPRAEHEVNKRNRKPLPDQLFYLGPSQDILRKTEERLDQVKQALR